MKVTRENYEAFLLDYAEGVLSSDQQAELFAFLDANPDLDVDFEVPLDPIPALPEAPSDWSSLLQSASQSITDLNTLLIAKLEGDEEPEWAALDFTDKVIAKEWGFVQRTKIVAPSVSFSYKDSLRIPAEITTVEEWKAAVAEGDLSHHTVSVMASAEMHREIAGYQATRLLAPAVVFNNKALLKQDAKVVPLFRRVALAAASIAAIFVCVLVWPETQRKGSSLANVQQVSVTRPLAVSVKADLREEVASMPSADLTVQAVSAKKEQRISVEPAVERERIAVLGIKPLGSIERQDPGRKLLHADDIEVRDAMLYAESGSAASTPEYQSLTEYVKERAQKDILKVAPTEPVAVALVEKAVNKIEKETDGAVRIQPSNKQTGTPFNLKLGKLEISRNR